MKFQAIKLLAFIALLTAVSSSCSKDENNDDDKLVSIKIQNWNGEVDPYIVSFALPYIVDARCYKLDNVNPTLPYYSYGGFPKAWETNDWFINMVMAKGTDRTKLAPIITLAPGVTITPKSGTVLDFSKDIEWTLKTPDGSTVKYYLASVFVIGDTDEANMVAIKIRCWGSGEVDPNIVSLSLPGIFIAPIYERKPYSNYGGDPNTWSPHVWSITLGMAKGTDCSKLSPIFSLAPGVRITEIILRNDTQDIYESVDYTGIVNVGVFDLTKQVFFVLRALDGSKVMYSILANALGDELSCGNCP